MRTMVKNGLQAVALNHQLRLGFRLFTVRGQQRFAALPLSGAYATQRQQSQVLLTTLEAQIAAVNQELATRAAADARVVRLRTHRSEEHTSELQSLAYLVCRLLLEKKKN